MSCSADRSALVSAVTFFFLTLSNVKRLDGQGIDLLFPVRKLISTITSSMFFQHVKQSSPIVQ